jgi:rhodanese-related sulfurtransferase
MIFPKAKRMKNTGIRIIFLMVTLFLTGPFTLFAQPKQIVKTINSVESAEMIKKNTNNAKFIILDVRTPSEYAVGHIANATNIDFNASDFAQKIGKLDKSKMYLVYCRSGHRSAGAVEIMKTQSFQTIYNLDGGITKWTGDNNPVVK